MYTKLSAIPGLNPIMPQGAMYMMVRLPIIHSPYSYFILAQESIQGFLNRVRVSKNGTVLRVKPPIYCSLPNPFKKGGFNPPSASASANVPNLSCDKVREI